MDAWGDLKEVMLRRPDPLVRQYGSVLLCLLQRVDPEFLTLGQRLELHTLLQDHAPETLGHTTWSWSVIGCAKALAWGYRT